MSRNKQSEPSSALVGELHDEIDLPFAQVPMRFIRETKGKAMSNHGRWLFVLLRGYLNRSSKVAFPSYETLKEDTSWALDTISKALKELEASGWLSRDRRFGKSTIYRLHLPQSSSTSSTDAKSFRIKSSVSPSFGEVETNQKKYINLPIGDTDVPHTPCQSFENEKHSLTLVTVQVPTVEIQQPDSPIVHVSVTDGQKPPTPLSTPRPKAKKRTAVKSEAEQAISRNVSLLMAYIYERMGSIDSPKAQGGACQGMLRAGYSVERIKAELEMQLAQLLAKRRNVVSWNTVKQSIASSVFAETQKQTTGGTSNGTTADNEPTGEFNLYEFIRKTTGNVGYGSKLLGTDQRSITG